MGDAHLKLCLIQGQVYLWLAKTSLANEKLLPPTHGRIKGVTGNFLNVLGFLPIVLEIEGAKFHHTVHIVKGLRFYAFILGLDFLRDNILRLTPCMQNLMLMLMLYVLWILTLG